ncbi:Clp protease N-terminal domain-containing protein [Cellulomonas sp. McL0617]|uniref:Clp protease N-terminal domain-containing protein n=1 Tax=Cellulomonas sp. McL0617 TaxID=3415675 RepID=UPI003CF63B4C
MFERFTGDARDAVGFGVEEANAVGADHVGAEHLLLGAVRTPQTVAARALARLGVDEAAVRAAVRGLPSDALDADALAGVGIDLEAVRAQVEAEFGPGALDDKVAATAPCTTRSGHKPLDAQAKKLLEIALREAVRLKHRRIDTGHLLLAVVRVDDPRAARSLDGLGLGDDDVRQAVYAAWAQDPAGLP